MSKFNIPNIELVKLLFEGYTISEIAKVKNINRRTLESKITMYKDRCNCKTLAQLVGTHVKRGLLD